MQERIDKIKEQIKELNQWKLDNSVQQIPDDISVNSLKTAHINHLVVTGKISTTVPFFDTWLEVTRDGKTYVLPATLSI